MDAHLAKTLRAGNLNTLWGTLIIAELIRNGTVYFCISSGSRSTPLTVAVARHPQAQSVICPDERGAAFHALGYTRASGKPAVLICTSGTAAANYYPAVVEAAMDRVPLLILTADRPPELHHTGANQTIVQPHLYGQYPKWHFELPCPTEQIPPQMVLTTVDQAVYQALRAPAGPVHLNCSFREPLAPTKQRVTPTYLSQLADWQRDNGPYTCYQAPTRVVQAERLADLASRLNGTQQGFLVVGRLNTVPARQAVVHLARKLNWPLYADVTSGLRLGRQIPGLIAYFDQLLLDPGFFAEYRPETVLHIGDQFTSKRLLENLEKRQISDYIMVADHPFRHDPAHAVALRLEADIAPFCQQLAQQIEVKATTGWLETFVQRNAVVESIIEQFMAATSRLNEVSVARLVARHIARQSGLFLASSMPIRDMDRYGAVDGAVVPVAANRGASGIDGTIATAAGFATGLGRPVTLLIGDLAFIHDLNALALLKSTPQPLVIVLLNNQGGGIFSFLPIARFGDVFERFFATPHELTFKQAAALFDLDYFTPTTPVDFTGVYTSALETAAADRRSTLIEVITARDANFELHQSLEQQIVAALLRI